MTSEEQQGEVRGGALQDPAESLTGREREILGLFATGMTNKSVAARLAISEQTVKAHAKSIYRKMRVTNRVQAILVEVMHRDSHTGQRGVVEPPAADVSRPPSTPKE